MDLTLAQEDPKYLEELSRYNRLLRQKQAVLRGWQTTGMGDEDLLRVLSEQMQPLNLSLFNRRSKWAQEMATLLIDHYQHISGGREVPSLVYKSGWPFIAESGVAGNRDELMNRAKEPLPMERMLHQEKNSGRCLWGIHRDDLQFLLDGHPLRPHASQGQQKSFVISLKLAQADLIRQATGTQPILLLDDVFEKLDEQRVTALLERVSHEPYHQVFITHTEEDRVRALLGNKADVDYIKL
jgi:DNA replication and repair protein RecF